MAQLAQRLMSHISMMFALAPAIAPVIGGRLQQWFGWQSVFAFLVVATFMLWFACWRLLPETLPVAQRQPLDAPDLPARATGKS
jgi:DHA1 family bicyclomycin/chloramphenicol resistance-like MFS transporter